MNETPSTPVQIREATPSDVEALGRFGTELMNLHHHWDPHRFIGTASSTPALYSSYLGSQLGKSDVFILVAEENRAVVGYVFARKEGSDYMALRGPAGIIHDIYVDALWRKQGIGKRLLDAAIAEFASRGGHQIVLSTAYRNEAGRALFAKAGLRPTMVEMTLDMVTDADID